jgi:hypothetical protein
LAGPWFALCAAVAVHVCDEALTGFLSVYNPTVLEARRHWPWFPMPTFTFRTWLGGLIGAVIAAALLTPPARENRRWFRVLAWIVAVLMMLNGLGHISGTILGHTFADIRFARPMPGFYSSPLLLAASAWLMVRLRESRPAKSAS